VVGTREKVFPHDPKVEVTPIKHIIDPGKHLESLRDEIAAIEVDERVAR
jgi:hypothetical protein